MYDFKNSSYFVSLQVPQQVYICFILISFFLDLKKEKKNQFLSLNTHECEIVFGLDSKNNFYKVVTDSQLNLIGNSTVL